MILICGHPNAGKTTYSSKFDNVLHLDNFPFNKFLNCNEAARQAENDVVIEGIYNLRCRREKLLEACADKSPKICIWIDTPVKECLQRENRGRTEDVVLNSVRMFEPPSYEEGWDEIKIIR